MLEKDSKFSKLKIRKSSLDSRVTFNLARERSGRATISDSICTETITADSMFWSMAFRLLWQGLISLSV